MTLEEIKKGLEEGRMTDIEAQCKLECEKRYIEGYRDGLAFAHDKIEDYKLKLQEVNIRG